MIKSHHKLFLSVLDKILKELDNPYFNYQQTRSKLSDNVTADLKYDIIPDSEKYKSLTEPFDKAIEEQGKEYLFKTALDFLIREKYVYTFNEQGYENTLQISHKGLLKRYQGFVKSFDIERKKEINREKRLNFELAISSLRLVVPPTVGFIFGWIAHYFGLFN